MPTTTERPVMLFDGVCNLCNTTVQFIIRHDKKKKFLFSPLQSGYGKKLLSEMMQQGREAPDSVMLSYKGKVYFRSDSVLLTAQLLGGFWAVLGIMGYILPRFARDSIYNWVAKHRYKWFGQKDQCMIPTPELNSRFLLD